MYTFAIYWILKKNSLANCDSLAVDINMLFDKLPNYNENAMDMRELKTKLYKKLIDFGVKDLKQAKKITETLIKLKRKK